MKFTISCVPPTCTSQQKRTTTGRNGNPVFFKSEDGKAAEELYLALLASHRPKAPILGPVCLSVAFRWPWRKLDKDTKAKQLCAETFGWEWFTGKPDADNAVKLLQDVLVKLRFFENDSQVCRLVVEKRVGNLPGIVIEIERMETNLEKYAREIP